MTDTLPTIPILIVEDEPKLAALLADYLRAEGYQTTTLADGLQVIPFVHAHPPALILLDLMLPGRGGFEICRELRTFSTIPVVILTARVDEIDRLLGLELGADDYVCKPFSPREVVARVKAILRRAGKPAATPQPEIAPQPPLVVDVERHVARLDDKDLQLTPIELRLLALLQSTPGRIYRRDHLLRQLYDDHRVVTDRTVDTHVKNLRRKLQVVRPGQDMIRSIYGVGYRLDPDLEDQDG
ncbi:MULTISPECIES: response regulator [Paraburkholderia]|jgi:two-component system response regulator BaeR|uniref:Two-component system, OmpR family, response regulator BaeR n=1 Tax=Paraburkholderia phenazinium TaxID=60549 RepID=A0A1N6GY06_9BURK|nr:response regulator [Paraburkholderia phenazinium]SIO12317.1 two-component system, OmpR family, response regulator BaeR [Paraburkholderia phenazinium]